MSEVFSVPETIGGRLKGLREAIDLTQEQVAAYLRDHGFRRVARQSVIGWESDKNIPGVLPLYEIVVNLYGSTMDYVITGKLPGQVKNVSHETPAIQNLRVLSLSARLVELAAELQQAVVGQSTMRESGKGFRHETPERFGDDPTRQTDAG